MLRGFGPWGGIHLAGHIRFFWLRPPVPPLKPAHRATPICFPALPPSLSHPPHNTHVGTPPPAPTPPPSLPSPCKPCSHANYLPSSTPPSLPCRSLLLSNPAAPLQLPLPEPLSPKPWGPLLNLAPTTCLPAQLYKDGKQAAGPARARLHACGVRSMPL